MMISLERFLVESGLDGATIERWSARAWIAAPQDPARHGISEIDAARARLIRDLKGDLGVNDEGIDVVLHLVDQVHGLRRALAALRNELGGTRE